VEELFLPAIELQEVNGDRQAEINTAQAIEPESSASEFDFAIEKLKSLKSPGIVQIPTDVIKPVVRKFNVRIVNLLFLF